MGVFDLQYPTVDTSMLNSVISNKFSPILKNEKITKQNW